MEILFEYILPALLFLLFIILFMYVITRTYFLKLLIQHMLKRKGYIKDGDKWVNVKENCTFDDTNITTIIECLKGRL